MRDEERNKYIRWIMDHVIDVAKDFLKTNWKASAVVIGAGVLTGGVFWVLTKDVAVAPHICNCGPVTACVEKCLDIDADK